MGAKFDESDEEITQIIERQLRLKHSLVPGPNPARFEWVCSGKACPHCEKSMLANIDGAVG
jgi:hypothetical protein